MVYWQPTSDLPKRDLRSAASHNRLCWLTQRSQLPNCQRSIPNAKTSPIGLRQISLRRTKNPEPTDTPLADRSLQVLKILRIGGQLSMEPNDFFLTAFEIRPSQLRCSFDSTDLAILMIGGPDERCSSLQSTRPSDATFPGCHNRRSLYLLAGSGRTNVNGLPSSIGGPCSATTY